MFPDLRRKPQHAHDLGHPGSGNTFLPCDLGLTCDLAGFQESLPLDGLAEELDYPGRLGFSGWFRSAPAWRDRAYHPGGRHPARQSADVAVFECPLGPEGNFDRLFAVGRHGGATVASLGEMDYPEIYLRLEPPQAGSNTVTYGEPALSQARGWGFPPPAGFFLSPVL